MEDLNKKKPLIATDTILEDKDEDIHSHADNQSQNLSESDQNSRGHLSQDSFLEIDNEDLGSDRES